MAYQWPSSLRRSTPAGAWEAAQHGGVARGASEAEAKPGWAVAEPTQLVPAPLGVGGFRAPRAVAAKSQPHGAQVYRDGGECTAASGSAATRRSVFGFPSASVSASVTLSSAAGGAAADDAEVTSIACARRAAAAAAAASEYSAEGDADADDEGVETTTTEQLSLLLPRAAAWRAQAEEAAEFNWAEQHAAARVVSPTSARTKRAAPDDSDEEEVHDQDHWHAPPAQRRRLDDVEFFDHQQAGGAVGLLVRRERLVLAPGADGTYLAHLSAEEALFLPDSPGGAHDARLPYDAEAHPLRRDDQTEE